MSTDQIEELKALHYEIRAMLESKQWDKLNKRMRHIRAQHDVNKSKMVLVATQQFINQPEILEERYKLYKWFNVDMGWSVFNKLPIYKNKDSNVPDKYRTP